MRKPRTVLAMVGWAILLAATSPAQMFYPDDPLEQEPAPRPTIDANYRELSDIYDLVVSTFSAQGERHPNNGVIPAQGVNTLGEVMDGPWFTNRHAKRRMTLDELKRGPGDATPPRMDRPLQVLTVKRYDVRPGLLVVDADYNMYLLRFDPPGRREMATGASMVTSRLYYALGYNVVETYLIDLQRGQLAASPEGEDINAVGEAKKLLDEDIDLFLKHVPFDKQKGYRALASRVPEGEGLGPYQFFGTRSDDPNDIYAHEHRRDLRGLHVYSAWVGNNWIRPSATFDLLVEENGVSYIKHYLTDFFASLGSGFQEVKTAREGNEPMFDFGTTTKNFFGFGIYAPAWQKAKYPGIRSVGRFEYETFDPDHWFVNTHLAPFVNRLPDDEFWAAKNVMSFTDEEIRAMVSTGGYSDPRAEEWIAKCLIERRQKIGEVIFAKVFPVDNPRVADGEVQFDDLEVKYGFVGPRTPSAVWFELNNFTREVTPIKEARGPRVPERVRQAADGSYFRVTTSIGEYGRSANIYLRKESDGIKVVGLDWSWAGKRTVAAGAIKKQRGPSRYSSLAPRQRELFDSYTRRYNEKTSFNLKPEEYWAAQSISERTTFDGVTHALMNTELTDAEGNSLGKAIDLVVGVERIAGQYYGRQGDEQFRVYVLLREDARETVEKCQEFARDHDNTVYHMGYPINFRQTGKVPTLQISMSEDGLKADIDVDYRSSKIPAAMWNGHLTSANSDVRAGNNYERHDQRWHGMVAWWKKLYGNLPEEEEPSPRILLASAPAHKLKPVPPNRPAGTRIAAIQDAVAEFLHDWLVRRNVDEALEFISDDALPCISLDAEREGRKPNRKTMREILAETSAALGRHTSLTAIIEAVKPWSPNLREIKHLYEDEFYLAEVADSVGDSFQCQVRAQRRRRGEQVRRTVEGRQTFGTYYGAIFRVRSEEAEEGAVALLWKRQEGAWRLVAWDVVNE